MRPAKFPIMCCGTNHSDSPPSIAPTPAYPTTASHGLFRLLDESTTERNPNSTSDSTTTCRRNSRSSSNKNSMSQPRMQHNIPTLEVRHGGRKIADPFEHASTAASRGS